MEQLQQFLTPARILDLCGAALILFMAARYASKGLAASLVQLVGTVAGFVGARWFADQAAPQIFARVLAQPFKERIAAMLSQGGVLDLGAVTGTLTERLPDSLVESVLSNIGGSLGDLSGLAGALPGDLAGMLPGDVTAAGAAGVADLAGSADQITAQLIDQVVGPLLVPMISTALFVIVFLVLRMVVGVLADVLTVVNHIPLIGSVNRTLGFVGGGLVGMLYLFIALCLLWLTLGALGDRIPITEAMLADSFCYRAFGAANPFVTLQL